MSHRLLKLAAAGALATSLFVAISERASAHGFGERYDLPVPLSLYAIGAGLAVAASFVIAGFIMKAERSPNSYWRFNLLSLPGGRIVFSRPTLWILRLAGIGALALVIYAGVAGTSVPSRNLAPTAVWAIWWVGVAYLSALVGNLWTAINPWSATFLLIEFIYRKITLARQFSLNFAYPERWERWPAVAVFLVFAWYEAAYTNSSSPSSIVGFVIAYSLFTLAGMFLFGRTVWLKNGEAFSVVFGLMARFSPMEFRVGGDLRCRRCAAGCLSDGDGCTDCLDCFENALPGEREINIRPYAAGLLRTESTTLSETAFIVTVLAAVNFDGITATNTWLLFSNAIRPAFSFYGQHANTAVNAFGLALTVAGFAAVYLVIVRLIKLNSREDFDTSYIARRFVLSLVPIALAYHLAHFFSFLVLQGQLIIPLASNPLGNDWDIFGTADHLITLSLLSARAAWIFAIAAIVIGHIFAVFLSHFTAMRTFTSHGAAKRSQYPMMALMIAYTMASLWIIAQPIVNTG
jgi:hypothetical protein